MSVINIWHLNIKIQHCNLFCKLIHFKPIVPVRFLTSCISFKCFDYNAECEGNVSPSSFDEQLPDLKSHVLSLSTQWMVCYQSAPGGVAGWNVVDAGDRLQRKNADLKSVIIITRRRRNNDIDTCIGEQYKSVFRFKVILLWSDRFKYKNTS